MADLFESLKNAFNKLEIRVFVLISLLFQVLQILFASGRKRNTSKAFTFFTWSIYLLADSVAGFTLGLLCQRQGEFDCNATPKGNITMINMSVVNKVPILSTSKHNLCHNYNGDLLAFWSPFLLLHLGGPDTITAYSVEDNSLWRRHLVGLLYQVGTAIYVAQLSLPQNKLLAPTILMLLAGIIKYSERTYALYRASSDVFRDSILTRKFDDSILAKDFSNEERLSKMAESAHELFMCFKGIIVDQCSLEFNDNLYKYFSEIKSSKAFKLVEYELSFLYDVLFTKATVLHTCVGYILRFLCTSLIIVASVLFFLSNNKVDFTSLDILVTYILLGGAISLDILAYIMLILSKWTIVRLKELETRFKFRAPLIVSRIISKVVLSTSSKWSGSMMQHSLVKSCLRHHGRSSRRIVATIKRSFRVDMKLFDKLESTWIEPITDELKNFIFEDIKYKKQEIDIRFKRGDEFIEEVVEKMSKSRGSMVLEKHHMDELQYSVEVRFEKSILMWNIATDICYYTEEVIEHQELMKVSMLISNYMLYLLFKRLSMIPSVTNWHLMYRQTRSNLKKIFSKWLHNNTPKSNTISTQQMLNQHLKDACNHFLSLSKDDVETSDEESTLPDALVLAKKLKKKVKDEERWKMVSEIWEDMLQYAAKNCPGIAHAQALTRGGELVTFVGFLISHFDEGRVAAHPKDYVMSPPSSSSSSSSPSSSSSTPDVGNQPSVSSKPDGPRSDLEDVQA